MFSRYRIGTITLALTLIGLGVLLLVANVTGQALYAQLLKWWPLILILLGLEMVGRHTLSSREQGPIWDAASIILLTFIALTLLAGSLAWSAPGVPRLLADAIGNHVEVTDNSSLDLSLQDGNKLVVQNPMGQVRVAATTGAGYRADVAIHATDLDEESARTLLNRVDVRVEGSSPTRLVVTLPPRLQGQAVSVDLDLYVPEQLDLEVRSGFGLTEVSDINGAVRIRHEHGDVQLYRIAGDGDVQNSFGVVRISGLAGSLRVSGEHTGAELEDIVGPVDLNLNHRDIRVERVDGSVSVQTEHSDVTVSDITGDLSVYGSHTPVEAVGIAGSVTIQTDYNPVRLTAETINSNVSIINDYGEVELRLPAGGYELDLEATRGSVNVNGSAVPSVESQPDREILRAAIGQADGEKLPLVRTRTSRAHINLFID